MLVGDLALDRAATPRSAGPSAGVSWRISSRSSCGADAGRVDGRDDVRPAVAALARAPSPPWCPTMSARYMWVWITSGRTSARWAVRAPDRGGVVRLVDDGHIEAVALELADGAPAGQRDDRRLVVGRVEPATSARTGAPGRRRWCRSRGSRRRGRGRARASGSARAGRGRDPRSAGAPIRLAAAVVAPDEQALDRLVDRAPLVLVGLVAAQEVEPRACPSRARDWT